MNKKRWNYLKSLAPPAPTYLHVAAEVGIAPNPKNPMMPGTPWVAKGESYNVGRNASKRADRNADIKMRAAARKAA